MSYRILLAIPETDDEVVGQARAILDESDVADSVQIARASSEVVDLIAESDIDIVVLHEHIGPVPVLELARELNRRHPYVGLVLIAESSTSELMRSAMFVGIRGVVGLPLGLEEFTGALYSSGEWATAVRDRMAPGTGGGSRNFGQMVCIAGGKGGVGATTLSVLLAEHLVADNPDRSICLVDLDLQAGDLRSLLDITHRRSILDLAAVVDELTSRHLDDALFRHKDGFQVLLPPVEGELAEDIDSAVIRRILGHLRSTFDLVIVDLGTIMTEASATAAEMANMALVVTQTDVPALRSVNRLLGMWDRLGVRPNEVHVVINRVDRDSEIQPDLCGRVVKAKVAKTTLPARFRDLEIAVNTGEPRRVEGPLNAAVAKLAGELSIGERTTAPSPHAQGELEERVLSGDSGQAAVDFVASLPLLAITMLLMWQIALTGWTQIMVQNASREAAHQLSISAGVDATGDGVFDDVREAARERIPAGWQDTLVVQQGGQSVRVEVGIPVLLPGVASLGSLSSRSGTVIE